VATWRQFINQPLDKALMKVHDPSSPHKENIKNQELLDIDIPKELFQQLISVSKQKSRIIQECHVKQL
jgi:hypothetical protein